MKPDTLLQLSCTPSYCWFMLILHPWGVEKFHAFLLPQRFLPGIQSHKGSGRKQVTGSWLPPELSCQTFPRMWSCRAGPGRDWESAVLGAGGEKSMCSPWFWLKHRTEPGSGPQCQKQAHLGFNHKCHSGTSLRVLCRQGHQFAP